MIWKKLLRILAQPFNLSHSEFRFWILYCLSSGGPSEGWYSKICWPCRLVGWWTLKFGQQPVIVNLSSAWLKHLWFLRPISWSMQNNLRAYRLIQRRLLVPNSAFNHKSVLNSIYLSHLDVTLASVGLRITSFHLIGIPVRYLRYVRMTACNFRC